MKKLPREFYNRSSVDVGPELLGCRIVSNVGGVKTGGMIVEAEAYHGPDDPACHAYVGRTKRNDVMFGPPGFLYVYFTYGNHFMLNVVCERDGFPSAVLLRAVEPVYSIGEMMARRGTDDIRNVSSGPGKLAQALGIRLSENRTDLTGPDIYICGPANEKFDIIASPRIGIGERGHEKLWRFYIDGNPHVSAGRRYERENSFPLSKARKKRFKIG